MAGMTVITQSRDLSAFRFGVAPCLVFAGLLCAWWLGHPREAVAQAATALEELISPKLPDGRQRAFPTAEGFGAAAVGGRGGR